MTDETKFHTIHEEIRNLVREVHDVSKSVAVYAEKLAFFSEKMSNLPCDQHIHKFDRFEKAITDLAIAQAQLIESHTTVKKIVFGMVTLVLTLSITAIYGLATRP